jgi:transposase InsO family protein
MVHATARLTVRTRFELVEHVQSGWAQAEVARLFRVSRATVSKWVTRFRQEGKAGLRDRSSRPRHSPCLTPPALVEAIHTARQEQAWGPHRIGWLLGIPRSTVYAVLRRAGLHRLAWLHRATREILRYEWARPGELLHLDIKKLGRIPPGGGKRVLPGFAETRSGPQRKQRLGFDFLHVAVDDHSRYAYTEALPDERGVTAAAFLDRALAHFAHRGVRVERVLTDNGSCYVSHAFRAVAATGHVRLKRTRPFRPQTNGKAEAFNKLLQNEWAYLRPYGSNRERLDQLPLFLAYYNERRPHGGIGGSTPASRL